MRITGLTDPRLAAVQRLALAALPKMVTAVVEAVIPTAPLVPPAQSQTSVAMLVAIAAADPEERRRRVAAAAAKGLTALERLHEELRVGRPGVVRLREIATWMDNHESPVDRDGAALLNEVELRVLVELAKAERDQ